jgi:hypothetical protein
MERLNKKTLSFPRKLIKTLAIFSMALTLSSCSKSDSSGNLVTPYGDNCANCAGSIPNPALMLTFRTTSLDGNISLENMQVFAQATNIGFLPSGNHYKSYSGPIAMRGTLVVKMAQYDYVPGTQQIATACVLPAGTYSVQTVAVGQIGYDGVDVLLPSLAVTGGGIELRIEAPSPMGFLDGGTSLWAKVSVVRANGVLCSPDFFGDFR